MIKIGILGTEKEKTIEKFRDKLVDWTSILLLVIIDKRLDKLNGLNKKTQKHRDSEQKLIC